MPAVSTTADHRPLALHVRADGDAELALYLRSTPTTHVVDAVLAAYDWIDGHDAAFRLARELQRAADLGVAGPTALDRAVARAARRAAAGS